MDADHFDALTRILGRAAATRRAALGTLLVAALGRAVRSPAEAAAAACDRTGRPCRKDGQCCSGRCKQGTCAGCPNGRMACGGACVNPNNDPKNCGKCNRRCAAGQACVDGVCQCGGASCPDGCCDGATCQTGTANDHCGRGGAACVACANDLECVGGSCACTAASCPSGCCAGATCKLGTADGFCGANGAACVACGTGQRCLNCAYVCDGTSCPNGCCAGATCVPAGQQKDGQCGANGATCAACQDGKHCCGGVCQECCNLNGWDVRCPSGYCRGDGTCAPATCPATTCGQGEKVICGAPGPDLPCTCAERVDGTGPLCASIDIFGECASNSDCQGDLTICVKHPNDCGYQGCAKPCHSV